MPPYPGGKGGAGVYQTLINQIPPHSTYIESHLGGGRILLKKKPAAMNIGIDLCGDALAAVQVCIAADGGGYRCAPSAASMPPTVMATLATAGGAAASSPVTLAPGHTVTNGDRIPRYTFVHGDCSAWLRGRRWVGGEFVYADPPYLMSTRRGGRLYNHEYTDEDHINLLALLSGLPSMVMISGYWSELYADLLHGWRTISFQTVDRGGNLRTEWAWMNYPAPVRLHDYSFLGDDYRERERIKRKRGRWVRMLAGMPVLERMAILEGLKELDQ